MLPLLAYANNETYVKYNLTWAPHHLGLYPIGNLQPYQQVWNFPRIFFFTIFLNFFR